LIIGGSAFFKNLDKEQCRLHTGNEIEAMKLKAEDSDQLENRMLKERGNKQQATDIR